MDVLKSLLCSALELELFFKKRKDISEIVLTCLYYRTHPHFFISFSSSFLPSSIGHPLFSSLPLSLSLSLSVFYSPSSFLNKSTFHLLFFPRLTFILFPSLRLALCHHISFLVHLYSILSPSRFHLSRFHLLPFSPSSSLFTSLSHLLTSPISLSSAFPSSFLTLFSFLSPSPLDLSRFHFVSSSSIAVLLLLISLPFLLHIFFSSSVIQPFICVTLSPSSSLSFTACLAFILSLSFIYFPSILSLSLCLIALPSFDVAKRQLTTDVRRMTLESRHELLDSYLFVILRNLIDNLFTFSQGQKPLRATLTLHSFSSSVLNNTCSLTTPLRLRGTCSTFHLLKLVK
ncbi:unnamed protein product [Acanthosepion pharaonis]|uniref:Uncharacterized protein n=1 Tax=Acanthosepion pharaonis TaxID=158019 RepID=A0A812DBS0_ACAPH|nr:unnamed protein product [Sepia pharaonis]